jgi:hypothetical protein
VRIIFRDLSEAKNSDENAAVFLIFLTDLMCPDKLPGAITEWYQLVLILGNISWVLLDTSLSTMIYLLFLQLPGTAQTVPFHVAVEKNQHKTSTGQLDLVEKSHTTVEKVWKSHVTVEKVDNQAQMYNARETDGRWCYQARGS